MTASWTPEQRKQWTDSIVDTFLQADASTGKVARQRLLSYETASALRRGCVKLRRRTADHRDVIKISVSLEALWNGASAELEDATWARCSLLFDTAMISLRVAYIWMYMKAESGGKEVPFEVKKTMFEMLVSNYFTLDAPTDDQVDKHSDNFGKLLDAWRAELLKYTESVKFDQRMEALEKSQSLDETANCIEKFLARVKVDDNWVLRMYETDREITKGLWIRRKGKRKASKSTISPDPDVNSVSSFEPRDADSDFDVQDAEAMDEEDESNGGKEENDHAEDTFREPRARRNSMVTRSATVGKRNVRTTRGRMLVPGTKESLRSPRHIAGSTPKRSPRLQRAAAAASTPRGTVRRRTPSQRDLPTHEPVKKARTTSFGGQGDEQKGDVLATNGTQPGKMTRSSSIPDSEQPSAPATQSAEVPGDRAAEIEPSSDIVAVKQSDSPGTADGATQAPQAAAADEMVEKDQPRSGGAKELRFAQVPDESGMKVTETKVENAEYDVPSYPDNAKKGSRPVVRDQDAEGDAGEKREATMPEVSANGEAQKENSRRPALRRSTRSMGTQ
eukprot:GFKZ01006277.1.p1 GENE.GFKZ01006277.1~~GFKZ01006277.1.p1  ORF type:complete len:594 (+),score=104.09 GFKZ01006277.1:97-1782(+)